jgi:hypothetical protein
MSDGSDSDADPAEEWVPVEDRGDEQSSESLHPFGGVSSDDGVLTPDDDEWDGDDDALYPWASGRGSTSGDAPWAGGELPDETLEPEYDVPWYVEWIGQSGVYLGVGALALAIGGISMAAVDIQPYANIAFVFSFVLVFSAMLLGIVFQAYVSVGDS